MRRFYTPLFLVLPLLIGGCQTVAVGVATPMVVQKRHVNLTNATYAAADTITQQTSKPLSRQRPLIVHDLHEIVHQADKTGVVPESEIYANPNLGRALTNQLTTRLVQLGFNVVDDTSTQFASGQGAELSGTYDIYGGNFLGFGKNLKVSLRLKDRASGRIIAVHDFTVPVTDEVRDYMASGNVLMPRILRD